MTDNISWQLIDKFFKENPNNLVAHHLESYNEFFNSGINRIFRENNPIRFIERADKENPDDEKRNQALLYLGGKTGDKIFFGKPIIYDDNYAHFMYPNNARLQNMTYGVTVHYEVDVDFIFFVGEERRTHSITLPDQIYLGRFPIMLQSNLCILKSLAPDVRFNMGECRNDYGGYFIIDGKEKVLISQEKFADNMIYIKVNKADNIYSHSAEIRSVSEDASKPIRKTSIRIVAPSTTLSNNQIVVDVPNLRKPVPLFILMRALGVISDKSIIEYCLLDLEKNASYVDMFIPSIHDASKFFSQEVSLRYIASLHKHGTVYSALDVLMNYFLPHVGETNFLDKAYFIGLMVNKLLRVFGKQDKPTDRDNFGFKRIELSGSLIYDLFREYYLIQKRAIALAIDNEHYYHTGVYKGESFPALIENNYREFFKERIIDNGFKKAFKGNWGAEEKTKRIGAVQDLNRLSWNSFISHLRKINLPLDASAKVVGPRLLNSSQWGYIDPLDTPDGGNIGLHKHLAISAYITSGSSAYPMIKWLRENIPMKLLQECSPKFMAASSKIIVNGNWIGVIDNPIQTCNMLKLFRRNGIIPAYTSITFNYGNNEIYIYTDAGRLTRPIYYIDEGKVSYNRPDVKQLFSSGEITWEQAVTGIKKKNDEHFNSKNNRIYNIGDLYDLNTSIESLEKSKSIIDYVDTSEEESALIATSEEDLTKSKYYTHMEIDPSLILGVLGNMIIYPEYNPVTRCAFSCGQSKQAVSVYHSNYQMRIDKMGVILNYGQIPLIKSRYLDYINKEEQPYGINAIVAIMSYTGYNVEDAILINEGSVARGLFRTTYMSMYESREESSKVAGSTSNSHFANIMDKTVAGIKPGYDYSQLDKWGLIKENTALDDKTVVIGKVTTSTDNATSYSDASTMPKKGQLGFVDKSFLTEGEEGFRIAKIRVREERLPAIGDKMASRAGQKGTIGLIIPEADMPFNAEGIRPDLIINPHAIPSRMTIGQLVEMLFGKACAAYGGFGDCTAFAVKGSNTELYGNMLLKQGFNGTGNELLYNGMSGEQLQADIFIGPTYYMRLKHMVKDKINYRARGPQTMLTRQPVSGRANDGGLRIGEMERDAILAHGAAAFLNDSYMIRGDEYYMAVCNKTGGIAIYNSSSNLFLSPLADGPIKFTGTMDGKMNIDNISRFGRSFSIVRIPYSLKLLIQELQVMNVQMRIITEDNIDQLNSMSYSDNINKLLKTEEHDFSKVVNSYTAAMKRKLSKVKMGGPVAPTLEQEPELEPEPIIEPTSPEFSPEESVKLDATSPDFSPPSPLPANSPEQSGSPVYEPQLASGSPAYEPELEQEQELGEALLASGSPAYNPNTGLDTGTDTGSSPEYNPNISATPKEGVARGAPPTQPNPYNIQGANKTEYDKLTPDQQAKLQELIDEKLRNNVDNTPPMIIKQNSILEVDTPAPKSILKNKEDDNKEKEEEPDTSNTKKTITFT